MSPNHDAADADAPSLDARDRNLDDLCENWASWCRARRLYWPASPVTTAIVKQGGGTRPLRDRGEVAIAAASLAAFHIAYTCQPNSLDKQVFDLYYVARVKPIKTAAAALGIGRSHFYRVLVEFRRRVHSAARAFEENSAKGLASHTSAPGVNIESVSQSRDNMTP